MLIGNGRQVALELLAEVRMLCRQLQRFAEMGPVFVPVKSRFSGGHFEQNAGGRYCLRPKICSVTWAPH